ncbi:MAG: polysulfide reductase NrfD, partial [Rhodospirillales bacterium]|nr:polysulfide reductase NrfD [Rhodospirillales bacterium]
LVMALRRLLNLQAWMTGRHLDVLCKLMLTSSLFVGYAYVMDGFTVFYGGEKADIVNYTARLFGYYAPVYWGAVLFNVMLPQLLWVRALRVNQLLVTLLCCGVIVGMWFERYTIVVISLHRPHLPSAWGLYHGSLWDWLTLMGTAGLFVFGILLAIRIIPAMSMFEMRETLEQRR